MDKKEEGQGKQILIKISDEQFAGRYSNQMMVRHTPEEFILDFINFFPGDNQASVVSRVIMSPRHIKRMLGALQENLSRFEEQFGKVKAAEGPEQKIGFKTE